MSILITAARRAAAGSNCKHWSDVAYFCAENIYNDNHYCQSQLCHGFDSLTGLFQPTQAQLGKTLGVVLCAAVDRPWSQQPSRKLVFDGACQIHLKQRCILQAGL